MKQEALTRLEKFNSQSGNDAVALLESALVQAIDNIPTGTDFTPEQEEVWNSVFNIMLESKSLDFEGACFWADRLDEVGLNTEPAGFPAVVELLSNSDLDLD